MIRLFALLFVLAPTAAAQPTSPEARAQAWQTHRQMELDSPFRDLHWRAIGPLQAGARVEAIAVPAGRPETIYAGIGSGNLWKSTNNGISWTPVFEHESAFSIGDVAVSTSNPDIVWVGTGETQPRHSGYSYSGSGVFRSTDAGATWMHMGLEDTHHIGKVLIDPRNPDRVWVAAFGHFWTPNAQRGLFRTEDGGSTWEKVLYLADDTGAIDAVMDPRNPDVIYASMWQAVSGRPEVTGPKSGVYRTTDGGSTWTHLTAGLPEGPLGRIGLDVSLSNPDVVYAFVDNGAESDVEDRATVGGEIYRSDDAGETWRRTHEDDLYHIFGPFGWKFADIRVSSDDENKLFTLGVKAYRSDDGGRTFSRIGEDILRVHDTQGEIMHLDHHEIWIDPNNAQRILLGNDGGVFQSWDGGDSWLHHNNIPGAEFYSISVDDASPYNVYGGTQDNAALYGPSDTELNGSLVVGSLVDPWENVYLDRWTGGDSFDTLLDPTDPRFVYYEHQHGAMMRMDITGESVQSGGRSSESIRPRLQSDEEAGELTFGWYAPIVISHHDPRTLYVGANRLMRSRDRGQSWEAVSSDLADEGGGGRAAVPSGAITFVAESPFRPDRIWVGTEGGSIWRTDDAGSEWIRLGHGLPDKWVSRLIASEHDPETVYAALSGFRQDDFSAYLYRSVDAGETWQSIARNLPASTVNVIQEDPTDAGMLYVGTDLGVYVSLDVGASWMSLSGALPTTPVHDLEVHPREPEVVIGTHGRGAFVLDVSAVRAYSALAEGGRLHVFDVKPAILENWEGRSVLSRPGTTYGEAVITYLVPSGSAGQETLVEISDADGAVVATLRGSGEPGVHSVRWDLVPPHAVVKPGSYVDQVPRLEAGVYEVVVRVGDLEARGVVAVINQ